LNTTTTATTTTTVSSLSKRCQRGAHLTNTKTEQANQQNTKNYDKPLETGREKRSPAAASGALSLRSRFCTLYPANPLSTNCGCGCKLSKGVHVLLLLLLCFHLGVVNLHGRCACLVVQCHHLTTRQPRQEGIIVAAIHT
jgi:hypothetical protein